MTLTIALAQLNPTVGDIAGNATLVRRARDEAAAQGADLVVFSELVIVGYPPEDLVLRPALVEAAAAALRDLEHESAARLTRPRRDDAVAANGRVYNAVALVADGATQLRFKHELPNYGVFDEKRVFAPGPLPDAGRFEASRLGVACLRGHLAGHVTAHLATRGAQMLLVPNGSPFEVDKFDHAPRPRAGTRVRDAGCRSPTSTRSAARTSSVFDGGSFVMNADGSLALRAAVLARSRSTLTRWTLDGKTLPVRRPGDMVAPAAAWTRSTAR